MALGGAKVNKWGVSGWPSLPHLFILALPELRGSILHPTPS